MLSRISTGFSAPPAGEALPLRRPPWALVAGCAVVALAAAADLLAPAGAVFLAVTLVGPLVASLSATPRQTAGVAVLAVSTASLLGLAGGIFAQPDHLIRVGLVGAAGAFSVYSATQRALRSEAMTRLAHVAEVAQEVMLRPPPPVLAHVALAARYVSASDGARVGGDLYETAYTPSGVRLVIGDVRGKGLDATRLAATVLAAFRESVWDRDLAQLAYAIDERVTKGASDEDFVTAVLAEFPHEGGLLLVNCGHHPPLRLREGRLEPLEPSQAAPPLGLAPAPRVNHYEFEVGDRVLLYTDGLVEARDGDGRFFPYLSHVEDVALPDLQESVDALVLHVLEHVPGRLGDDLAVLLVQRLQ